MKRPFLMAPGKGLIVCTFLALFLSFNLAGYADEAIRLASWNIRIFSDGSRDDAELNKICQNLKDYDFVSIVELRDEKVLQRTEAILQAMGKDYDYQVSDAVGRGVKERYAFLYDASKVEVVEPGTIFPDPEDVFIREPYYASFRSGKFDFTIIAIHVIWGDTVGERRAEIQKLADVYSHVQESNSSEQDVILAGDFNREPNDVESYAPLRNISFMMPLFSLPQKSHIKESSLYDNIWFQSEYVSEYTGTSGIDKFDETDFADDDKAANLAVSDHRPVWAEFHTDKDDDGLEPAETTGEVTVRESTWGEIRTLKLQIVELQKQITSLNKRLDALEQAQSQRATTEQVERRVEESQSADNDTTVYVTRTGKKYHKSECSYLKSSIPIKKSAAISQGYTPCSRCSP